MGENFYRRISYLLGLLPIGAIFGLAAFVAQVEVKDLDLWLHLGMGRFIMQHHYVPAVDILSCTMAGAPWINHEWLFQVIVFNLFKFWGSNGLIMMQVSIVVLTLLVLLFLGYSKPMQLPVAFFLFMVFLVFQQRFTMRPDLYSLLFFALYIYLLAIHVDKKWMPAVLFFIQILWVNIHGFFFFGPLFLLIAIFSEWIKRKVKLPYEWNEVGRLTNEEFKRLLWTLLFVVVACFVNPYFHQGALYPINILFSLNGENKIFFEYIQELQKPVVWGSIIDQDRSTHYKLFILISFISFVFNRRKIDISALLIWIVFLLFSLGAVRNLTFFSFAAYLVIITNFLTIPFENIIPFRFTDIKFRYITESIVKILFLFYILQFSHDLTSQYYYDFDKYQRKSEFKGISLKSYPIKAVDFLVKNKVQGNFFNDFNSGAYLVGRTSPRIHVFIDGRTEVYGGEFFKMYQNLWEGKNSADLEKVISKYNITGAFLNASRHKIPADLLNFFYKNKEWTPVYFDHDAIIFLRNTAVVNQVVIKNFAIDFSKLEVKKIDLVRLGVERVTPSETFSRAFSLEAMGLYDLALAECEMALKVNPAYADIYNLAGKIYAKRGDYQKAFESFRITTMMSPSDKMKRSNLALSLMDLKDYNGAASQYVEMSQGWPTDPKPLYLLAKAYILNQQYDQALDALKRAYALDPKAMADVFLVADLLIEKKEYSKAKDAYEIVLMGAQGTQAAYSKTAAYVKIANLYLLENKTVEAINELKKILEINPDSVEIQNQIKELESADRKPELKE